MKANIFLILTLWRISASLSVNANQKLVYCLVGGFKVFFLTTTTTRTKKARMSKRSCRTQWNPWCVTATQRSPRGSDTATGCGTVRVTRDRSSPPAPLAPAPLIAPALLDSWLCPVRGRVHRQFCYQKLVLCLHRESFTFTNTFSFFFWGKQCPSALMPWHRYKFTACNI